MAAAIDQAITDRGNVAALRVLYTHSGSQPLWIDAAGRPTDAAWDLVGGLEDIGRRGLEPADYDATRWRAMAVAWSAETRHEAVDVARVDVGLSLAFIDALSDLHTGRVNPVQLGFLLQNRREPYDPTAIALRGLERGRVVEAFTEAEPRLAQYRRIKDALAIYRSLAGDSTLERLPAIRGTIRPGDRLPAAGVLRKWLRALGDLPPDAAGGPDSVYAADIVRGVRSFQARRGLDSAGILGPETVAALRTPIPWYVRRLELALERLRWVPDRDTGRVIVVDIPAFRLWALDSITSAAAPALAMNAIVGQALRKQTPVLEQTMRSVVFRPYWDVPPSIARREIVPELRRDPAYLTKNDMELVPAAPLADAATGLTSGRIRVRQRPGPENALGLIKFVFPNDRDIYLHGTPMRELFRHTRRDFSHGCIRVEDPDALARYVLRDNSGWTAEHIDVAMHGAKTLEVELATPIPVLVFYATAVAWPDGRVAFYPDVYGHDARLDRALREQGVRLRRLASAPWW